MKIAVILLLLSMLTGCSNLPSVEQCEYVKYERRERAVYFTAHCHVTPGVVGRIIQ